MYCQKCGSEMSGCTICPVCGNEQRISWADKAGEESRAMKFISKAAEFGRSIVEDVAVGVLDNSIHMARAGVQKETDKMVEKVIHKMLVKMKLEKKTLNERVHDVKKKRRK